MTAKNFNILIALINDLLFKPCGLELKNIVAALESQEYSAHDFQVEEKKVQFRVAKITPTKTGQFVTIWKRNEQGITAPFDVSDDFDFFIIATQKENNFGVFIFPKTVLHQNSILSDEKKDGKRGIRVYPPWDLTTNKQAQKTQLWQCDYFVALVEIKQIDVEKIKILFK